VKMSGVCYVEVLRVVALTYQVWKYSVNRNHHYMAFYVKSVVGKGIPLTSLKKRLDNVLAELAIIREGLNSSGRYPSCCLTVHNEGKISCDTIGPLSVEEFLKECTKCQAQIKSMLSRVNIDDVQS